ncbi:MAG: hypothetical protein M0Q44_01350 [Methylobacter sp.]|jgi:hypothetical protein|nr:hypothetical protein [Methylobacter sp.]
MKKLILGAPSLTGKDANDLVAAAYKDAAFPMQLKVTNLVARPLSFPEIAGLHLKPCTHGDEATVVVTVPNYDALQRLASSIEQVAELNHSEAMLEMGVFDPDAVEAEPEVVAADATGLADGEVKVEAEPEVVAETIALTPVTGKKHQ